MKLTKFFFLLVMPFASLLLLTAFFFGALPEEPHVPIDQFEKKLISKNKIYAINNLGVRYSRGDGVKKNPQKAFELYTFSAERGDFLAMYNLGLKYSNLDHGDKAVPVNYELAAKWYKQSLETKHNMCAANDLGILYATGHGTQQDQEKAKDFFKQALQYMDAGKKLPDFVNAFTQYQFSLALNENTQMTMQEYSADQIKLAKTASQKLVDECWK
jgi:TPR repeat protein